MSRYDWVGVVRSVLNTSVGGRAAMTDTVIPIRLLTDQEALA